MTIKLNQRVTIISRVDDLKVGSKATGVVIESRNPSLYPFTLLADDGSVSPIYSTELNTWLYINGSDVGEKVFEV